MKRAVSILILGITASVSLTHAQTSANTTEIKPSADACPSWNKKQPASKANYFAYLRKSPAANKQSTGSTHYAGSNYYQPVSTNSSPERAVPQNNFSEPRYRKTTPANPRPTTPPAAEPPQAEPGTAEKTKTPAPAPAKTKTEEKTSVPEQKIIAEKKDKDEAPAKTGTVVNSGKKENTASTENALLKKKHSSKKDKSARVKKTKFKKNRATKCPSF